MKYLGDEDDIVSTNSIELLDISSTTGANTSMLTDHQQAKLMNDIQVTNSLITYLNWHNNKKGSIDNKLTCLGSIDAKEKAYHHVAKGNTILFQGNGAHRSLPSQMTKSCGTDKSSYDFSIKGDSLHSIVNYKDVLHTSILLSNTGSDIDVGVPVWELDDITEVTPELVNSHISTLVPMSRFVLLDGDTFIATNGAYSSLYSPTNVMTIENKPVSINNNIPWNNLRNIPNVVYNKLIKRNIELVTYVLNDVLEDNEYVNIELITPSIETSSGEIYAINNDGNSISYDVNILINGNEVNTTINTNLTTLSDLLTTVTKFENFYKKLTENKRAYNLYENVSTMLNDMYIVLSKEPLTNTDGFTPYAYKLRNEIVKLIRDIVSPKTSSDLFNFYKTIKMIGYKNEKRK
jgi:hypothetical protein